MADEVPKAGDGALAGFSEHGLEAREGLFDGIEVGAVGRKEAQARACILDHSEHRGALVAGEIVHDDDVTGLQFGDEHLADVSFEPIAVDRSVEHHRRDHPAHSQPRDQRGRYAVTMREAHPQPLAFWSAAMAAGHVGRGPRLVDEHQPLGGKIALAVEPAPALPQDVGPVLLDRVAGLFSA